MFKSTYTDGNIFISDTFPIAAKYLLYLNKYSLEIIYFNTFLSFAPLLD